MTARFEKNWATVEEGADFLKEPKSKFNLLTEIPDSQPDHCHLPSEIPDSQPKTFEYDLPDARKSSDSASFRTVATEIIPVLTQKPEPRYPLHKLGINCNGRLPTEAPQHRPKDGEQDMEDQPTQPSTQPFLDPRRNGSTKSREDQDEADIICILVPASPPAYEAVKLTAKATPQHILENHALSQVYEDEDTMEEAAQAIGDLYARDIALRFSSKIHDLCLGFTAGRNPTRCDLLLGDIDNKKFSNRHFRIFLNQHGALMLEDMSTNGTVVSGRILRGNRSKIPGKEHQPMNTLQPGDIIEVPTVSSNMEKILRFLVRMPTRDNNSEKYGQNLRAYLACVAQAERQAAAVRQAATQGQPIKVPPNPVHALNHMQQQNTTPNGSLLIAATTGNNNQGLHWNGGDKYNVISLIGKGAFAMVYKLSSKRDGEPYAVKEISKHKFIKDGILGHKFHNELNLMKSLNHPNIVRYIEHHENKTHLFIVMEFIACGDLTIWTNSGNAMPEYVCVYVAHQILQALEYLHKQGITHRDIKPDNILMASDYPYVFKLSDFGLSKIVTSDETFLTTFCGTLLYCAPEVYPGYMRVKSGLPPSAKRTRASDGPPPETLPYKHSVDTWSLAAVLYHLICGRPPFPGTPGDRGDIMLVTVMSNPVEWESLRQAGVSDAGIDFLQRALVTDPSLRAQVDALLRHPWVIPKASNEMVHLDASQLSITDENTNYDDGLEYEMEGPGFDTERFQTPPNEDENQGYQWTQHLNQPQVDITRPPPSVSGPPPPNRLFGEIGSSALRSSGALGQNAHAALGVPTAGSYDPSSLSVWGQKPLGRDSTSAEGALIVEGSAGYQPSGGVYQHNPRNPLHLHTTSGPPQNIYYPHLPSGPAFPSGSPSLFGAEALVGQLHMASPESGTSAAEFESKPATPNQPKSREMSPAVPGSKRGHENLSFSDNDEEISKRSKIADRIQPSPHSPRPSNEVPTQRPYTAGRNDRADAWAKAVLKQKSQVSNNAEENQEGQQLRERSRSDTSLLPTAVNSQDSACDSSEGDKAPNKAGSRPTSSHSNVAAKAPTSSHSNTAAKNTTREYSLPATQSMGVPQIATAPEFAKPQVPICFGNLIPTRGSCPTVPRIRITGLMTTYGRDPSSSFVHANMSDNRISKNAIDIMMWYPGIHEQVAAGKTLGDVASNKNLTAIISTRTSTSIKVNDLRLMRGVGCNQFGRLKTGDIVTVFEHFESQTTKNPKEKEFLKFRCEFFVGRSREVRKPSEPFVVENDIETYKAFEAKKSRESSVASEGQAHAGSNAEGSKSAGKSRAETSKSASKSATGSTRNTSAQ